MGQLVASLSLLFGASKVLISFYVASIDDVTHRAAAKAEYLGSGTTGAHIDKGVMLVIFAICLGILTDISRSVKENNVI